MRKLFIVLLLLYYCSVLASAAMQTDVIKSTVLAGKFKCTFHLVLFPTYRINLKKSKVSCSPKRPKHQQAKNVKLSGKLGMYLVSLSINPSKIKSAKMISVEATTRTTKPTISATSTSTHGPDFCQLGFTRICKVENNHDCPAEMHKFCPNEKNAEEKNESSQGCSCLPTLLVQQAIQAESSPFGCNGGCACVELELMRCGVTTHHGKTKHQEITTPREIETTRMPDIKTSMDLNEMTSRITTRTPAWMETQDAPIQTSLSLGEDEKLLFLGPGESYYSTGRCEVLTLPDLQPSNCSVPLHPLSGEWFSAYVGTMTQWGTMICGGDAKIRYLKKCYIYKHGVWKSSTPMLTGRSYSSGAWIDGLWWVTGGHNLKSTEMYDPITQKWSVGIDLPRTMSGHCMVAINSTHVFIAGTEAYIYSKDTGFVRIPEKPNGNPWYSPCAILGQNVWSIVGIWKMENGKWNMQNYVEYFNLNSLSWHTGPSLPADVYPQGNLLTLNGKLVYIEKGIYGLDNGVWGKVGNTSTARGSEKVALEWGSEDCLDTGTTTAAGP